MVIFIIIVVVFTSYIHLSFIIQYNFVLHIKCALNKGGGGAVCHGL